MLHAQYIKYIISQKFSERYHKFCVNESNNTIRNDCILYLNRAPNDYDCLEHNDDKERANYKFRFERWKSDLWH